MGDATAPVVSLVVESLEALGDGKPYGLGLEVVELERLPKAEIVHDHPERHVVMILDVVPEVVAHILRLAVTPADDASEFVDVAGDELGVVAVPAIAACLEIGLVVIWMGQAELIGTDGLECRLGEGDVSEKHGTEVPVHDEQRIDLIEGGAWKIGVIAGLFCIEEGVLVSIDDGVIALPLEDAVDVAAQDEPTGGKNPLELVVCLEGFIHLFFQIARKPPCGGLRGPRRPDRYGAASHAYLTRCEDP